MVKKRSKQKQNQESVRVTEVKRLLFSNQYNPATVFLNVKMRDSLTDIHKVARALSSQSSPFLKFIYETPIANAVEEIQRSRYTYYSGDILKDLAWYSLALENYSETINIFLRLRSDYENSFLKADYESALKILNKIEAETGVSRWSLESRFVLLEYSQGFEANARFLSDVNKKENISPLLLALIKYYSMRAERKISADNYILHLKKDLDSIKQHEHYVAYLQFVLDLSKWNQSLNFAFVTFFDANAPIIDRYTTFISLCRIYCANGGDPVFQLEPILARLVRVIYDPFLECIFQRCDSSYKFNISDTTKQMIEIIDAYTVGNYSASMEESKKLLQQTPNIFELYDIYVKSSGYLGEKVQPIFDKECLSNSIARDMDYIYRKTYSTEAGYQSLLKTAYTLGSSALATRLVSFHQTSLLPDARFWKALGALTSNFPNPTFCKLYDDQLMAIKYLETYSAEFSESITIANQLAIHRGIYNSLLPDFPIEIPETRRMIMQASVLVSLGEKTHALEILEKLYFMIEKGINGYFLFLDELLYSLFHIYLQLDNAVACIRLVVHNYFKNPLSIQRLPLHVLIEYIDKNLRPELCREISYPILYAIFHRKARPIYIAYDNFLSSHGFTMPNQLISDKRFSSAELCMFLGKVCTLDVMAGSYHFSSTEAIESERLRLCQYLSTLDIPEKGQYVQEISDISERYIIRQGMREIDEGKIYINERGIKTSSEKLLKENFNRFLELASINELADLHLLSTSNLTLLEPDKHGEVKADPVGIKDIEELSKYMKIVPVSHVELFKDLFLEIRDLYISSSEYGLDSYLSIRIRHGILGNEIRNSFDSLHLVSERDKNSGEYQKIQYWADRLNISSADMDDIQRLLISFSEYVDSVIIHLNDKIIQIRTETKNPEGMFNYIFKDGDLLSLFMQEIHTIQDYSTFIDVVFRQLRERTALNLAEIQRYIREDITSSVYEKLIQLREQVRAVVSSTDVSELNYNITTCLTDVQNDFAGISRWFAMSGATKVRSFNIDNLIQICITSIKNVYPNRMQQPIVNNNCHQEFDGKYFAPFSDIFRTLLGNIVVHAGLPQEELQIQIDVISSDEKIVIKFQNNLSNEVRSNDPVLKLNDRKSVIYSDRIDENIKKEGGTGYLKINKLLKYDLARQQYDFNFAYSDHGDLVVVIEMELGGLTL